MDLRNMVTIQLVSADIPHLLRELNKKDITVFDIQQTDYLTVVFQIERKNLSTLRHMAKKRGDQIRVITYRGIFRTLRIAFRRPVLMCFLFVLVFLSLYLPTKVLFVEVEGNAAIPDTYILEKAEVCGIRFGASRRKVRSEQMKNKLLAVIPGLQWAGINTSGCVATISVEEKSAFESTDEKTGQVCSIVAAQDGVITGCTVQRGTLLCRVGQAVKAGEMLVSGYTDCGLTVQATQAEAEITARTLRRLTAVTPAFCTSRDYVTGNKTVISIQIGKKLINFSKGSGISDATCVKMYSKKYLTLPGGRTLPVAVVAERQIYYQTQTTSLGSADVDELLTNTVRDYLNAQMIAGQIMHADTEMELSGKTYQLSGAYGCTEMIGQVINEECIYSDGKNN